jgi:predicted AlkP superfamily pyrophosphatase or phosphodiesterase
MRIRSVLLLALTLSTSTGCLKARYVRSDPSSRIIDQQRPAGLSQHVVVVSVDGFRPDAIGTFEPANITRLVREGSYTLSATTILPSKTLPSHTSMLTGQPPAVHGVSWNNSLAMNKRTVTTPTVFGTLRPSGYVTAAFFSKSKFTSLQRQGTLDYSQAPGILSQWRAEKTVRDVERYLTTQRPNLLFIHLGDTDRAGHDAGWMSAKYGEAVLRIDSAVGDILAIAERTFGSGNFTFILTSDHGGHNRNHGSADPRDVTIPWIAWGRGVKGGKLERPVETTDTAATILWLFGVGNGNAGKPVTDAFEN